MGNSQVTRPELLSVFGSTWAATSSSFPSVRAVPPWNSYRGWSTPRSCACCPTSCASPSWNVRRLPSCATATPSAWSTPTEFCCSCLRRPWPPSTTPSRWSPGFRQGSVVRARRAHALFQQFINDLDSGGTKVSTQLSEVDLSDRKTSGPCCRPRVRHPGSLRRFRFPRPLPQLPAASAGVAATVSPSVLGRHAL